MGGPSLLTAGPVAGVVIALAAPVLAQDRFTPPAGCTVFATVQHQNCEVSQHYRCDGDARGDQWSLYADGSGPFFLSRIDHETRWIESHNLGDGRSETLGEESDPASFSALLSAGRDDYDFTQIRDDGTATRYVGHDRLTGQRITVNGVVLERTEFDITAYGPAGEILWHRTGNDLIQRDWRLFFGDREQFENAQGDKAETISTPVAIAQPGDKGFLSMTPQIGCDMLMTELVR